MVVISVEIDEEEKDVKTVRDLIEKLNRETFENEKDYTLDIVDRDGNEYKVAYYDWCDTKIVLEKI